MNHNLRLAQIVNQTSPNSSQSFCQGDIICVLYEFEKKVFAKNLTCDRSIFDFVQLDHLFFIDIPIGVAKSSNSLPCLYVATSDFTECEPGDLNFTKYQIVIADKLIDENWLSGSYWNDRSRRGIFPITHVQKVSLDFDLSKSVDFGMDARQAKIVKPVTSGLKAKIGDNILIIGKLNEYFYYGENLDLEKNLVLRDTFVYTDEQNSLFETNCVAKFDFEAENVNELDCCKGDQLQLLQEINSDWLKCMNRLGITGLVPKNFVSLDSHDAIYRKSHSLTNASIVKPIELRSQSLTPEMIRICDPPPRPPKPPGKIVQNMNIYYQADKKKSDNSNISSLLFDFMDFGKLVKSDNVEPKESESEKSEKRRINRLNVLQELVDTERNYLNELKLCYECFMSEQLVNLSGMCPREFNKMQIFTKFTSVIDFSSNLIDRFDTELNLNQNDFLKCKFSYCIHQSLEQMKTVYAQYGRFYEEISLTLKNYEQNPEITSYIKDQLKIMKGKLSSVDLSSIVIKPVQRVIKYPLFINRIIENLDKSDEEYSSYVDLREKMSLVLDFINEEKRGQDLVAKYLKKTSSNDSSSYSLSKGVQTFKKLKDRYSLQIYKSFGWIQSQINDQEFDQIESYYRSLENALRSYFNDLNYFLDNLKSVLDSEKDIYNKLLFIFDDEFEKFYMFDCSASKHRNKFSIEYTNLIISQVISPIKSVISVLSGPDKLIKKRYDKQLDYQNALFESQNKNLHEKETENKLDRAKKDYQALNKQLIDELQILSQLLNQVLLKSFKIFTFHTHQFIDQIHSTLKSDIVSSGLDLTKDYGSSRIHMNSVVSRLLAVFSGTNQTKELSCVQITTKSFQTEEERNRILNTYPMDKIYMVTQRYVANENLCQLCQNVNDIVGLKKPNSPSGDSNVWFVYNGKMEGFVPAIVLEPYGKFYNHNNLICLEDDDNVTKEVYCIAKYPLHAKTSNMISLIQGECYKIVENKDQKGNCEWWLVEDKNGKIGYAPYNYLQILS